MSIASIVTAGYGTGTFDGSIAFLTTRGYSTAIIIEVSLTIGIQSDDTNVVTVEYETTLPVGSALSLDESVGVEYEVILDQTINVSDTEDSLADGEFSLPVSITNQIVYSTDVEYGVNLQSNVLLVDSNNVVLGAIVVGNKRHVLVLARDRTTTVSSRGISVSE